MLSKLASTAMMQISEPQYAVPRPSSAPWLCGRSRASFYYLFMVFVVIRYKTKATAGRALAFIVRIFVNDTIAIAIWTSFHAIAV